MWRLRRAPLSWHVALAALAGAAPYLHTVVFRYVYDDRWTLVENSWLSRPFSRAARELLNGEALRAGAPDATRPAMALWTWIDRRVGSPEFAHLESALLHGLVAGLAMLLAFALLRRRGAALATALLFAVSSAHVEATAVINYREDLLVAAAVLGVLGVAAWPAGRRTSLGWDFLAALGFAVGLCAKESALALLPLLGWVALSQRWPVVWLFRRERLLVSLGAVLVVWGSWRWALFLWGDDLPRAPPMEGLERLLRFARYEMWVLRGSFFPALPVPIYDAQAKPSVWFVLVLSMVVAIAGGWGRSRRWRWAGLGVAWVLMAPWVSSPLVGPLHELADRYLLLPSFGAALAVCALGRAWLRGQPRTAVAGCAVLACISLGVTLWGSTTYRDEPALARAAVERAPTSARAWEMLAYVLRHQGALEPARRAADSACQLAPESLSARITRAYVLLELGELEAARVDVAWARARGSDAAPGLPRAIHCSRSDLTPSEVRDCVRGVSP